METFYETIKIDTHVKSPFYMNLGILILFFRGEFYPLEDQVIHGLWCDGPLGD